MITLYACLIWLKRAIQNSSKLYEVSLESSEDAVAYSEIHKVFALLDELCPSV